MHTSSSDIQPETGPEKLSLIDQIIENESELIVYLNHLREKKIRAVALDMEGDQGLLRYNYSISIFQCFDGEKKVIIDVLKIGKKQGLHQFLTCNDIVKVMFSCPNDIFMTQNVLGCTIAPVRDIAVGQKLLGLPVNLSDYLKIDKVKKDSFQRANWLKRPIKPELLDYAINDVLELFNIESQIETKLRDQNLYEKYLEESSLISKRNFVVNQLRLYKQKFPGFKKLKPEKKLLAANVWIFRELIGRHFDIPVGFLLSKQSMVKIVRNSENLLSVLEEELNRNRKAEKRIDSGLIERYYSKAERMNKRQ